MPVAEKNNPTKNVFTLNRKCKLIHKIASHLMIKSTYSNGLTKCYLQSQNFFVVCF